MVRAGKAEVQARALREQLDDVRKILERPLSDFYDTDHYEPGFSEETP